MAKPTYVLGVGLSHDGSACLLKNGNICVAVEKERVTRIKHDGYNDLATVKYCLESEGITIADVRLVVQNANFGMMKGTRSWWYGPRPISADIPTVTISHHLAHAYSAIATCPFEESAVLVIDGCGNAMDECSDLGGATVPPVFADAELHQLFFEKDSFYIFSDNKMRPVFKDFSPWGIAIRGYPMCPNTTRHSIGGLYSAVSAYVFRGLDDPGKLMGLAPYGRPGVYAREMFDLRDGRVFVRYDWMGEFDRPAHTEKMFRDNFQYYADIAHWAQREIERAILYIVNSRYELAAGCKNLSYAGGVALNAVANARVCRETPFGNFYIQPAAGDNGLALGCAVYGWIEILGQRRGVQSKTFAFGRSYDDTCVSGVVARFSNELAVIESKDIAQEAARHLAAGKIVGWFQNRSEFGPRALGYRSILADPRLDWVRDFINSQIKRREDFRPFAPSVLAEDAGMYFECGDESPYMLRVYEVRAQYRDLLPAVIHKDSSARVQTVTKEANEIFWRLLCFFREVTGISILLNTSLNERRMPIVEKPEEAIALFLRCPLDILIINNLVITKRASSSQPTMSSVEGIFEYRIKAALEKNQTELNRLRGIYQVRISGTRTWTIVVGEDLIIAEGASDVPPDGLIQVAEGDFVNLYADPYREGHRLIREGKVTGQGSYTNLIQILALR